MSRTSTKARKTKSLNRTLVVLLLLGFCAALVLLVSLDLFSIWNYQSSRQEKLWNELDAQADMVAHDLKDLSSDAANIHAANNDFADLGKSGSAVEAYTAASELNKLLYGMMSSKEQLNGYIIFYNGMEDFQSFYESDVLEYYDMALIRTSMKEKMQNRGNGRHLEFLYQNGKNYALHIMKKGKAGIVMVSLLDHVLREVENAVPETSCFFVLVEGNGETDFTVFEEEERVTQYESIPKKSLTSSGTTVNHEILNSVNIQDTKLWLVSAEPMTIWSYLSITQLVLLALTILAVLTVVVTFFRFREGIIRPLSELVVEMNGIKDGKMDHRIDVRSEYDEISLVSVTLDQMLREVERQKDISYQETIEKQKAQMQFLSMQLKPHFYLNGLKTLNAFAMNGDKDGVQDVIMRLSYHMRYILQLEKDTVLLQDEIEYVNNYIELQKEMTDRPIQLSWMVSAEELQWRVPALCIQTFVENSCKYARVGNAVLPLKIRIMIDELETEDGRFLDINVCDNGNGYPEQILRVINGDPTESAASVGVNNLKRRCRILYGEWAEYNFYNDGGAVSELILPEIRQEETNELTDCG